MNKTLDNLMITLLIGIGVNFCPLNCNFNEHHMQIVSVAQAETKIYTGEGFFVVVDETLDYAKNKAKFDGARMIAGQIFVEIQSNSEVKNSKLIHDEIIVMTESVMKILDVKYKIESAENNSFIVRAIVTAKINTDDVDKIFVNRQEQKKCE